MQFVFTYIRKPVRLTWVWRIFALTGRHMSTQPRDGEWFRAGQSKLPDRTSHSADSRQAAWRTYRFASSRSQLRTKTPSWEKWGSRWVLPISLSMLLLRGTPRWSHPGSGGRGVAQPLTPQLLPEQTPGFANTSRQLFLPVLYPENPQRQWFSHLRVFWWFEEGVGGVGFFFFF